MLGFGKRSAWGLDIGQYSIKAARLTLIDGKPVLSAFEVVSYDRPLIGAGPAREELIEKALSSLIQRYHITSEEIAIALPGQTAFVKTIKLPPVGKGRIAEIVRYEAQQQIPFDINEVRWDYQVIGQPTEENAEIEVGLFAVKKDAVEDFMRLLDRFALNLVAIQISPLALNNFFSYDQPREQCHVLVDIGAGNTDLIVIDGTRFWPRNLPIAGNDLTDALKEKFRISFEEAENLKCKASRSAQSDRLFGVITPTLRDLISEIQRSLGFYRSQIQSVRFNEVTVLGNGSRLSGMIPFLKEHLQYPVSELTSLQKIAISEDIQPGPFAYHLRTLGPSFGLALQALGLGHVAVNLIPPRLVTERQLKRKRPVIIATLAVLTLLLFTMYLFARAEYRRWDPTTAAGRPLSALQHTLKKKHQEVLNLRDEKPALVNRLNRARQSLSALPRYLPADRDRTRDAQIHYQLTHAIQEVMQNRELRLQWLLIQADYEGRQDAKKALMDRGVIARPRREPTRPPGGTHLVVLAINLEEAEDPEEVLQQALAISRDLIPLALAEDGPSLENLRGRFAFISFWTNRQKVFDEG